MYKSLEDFEKDAKNVMNKLNSSQRFEVEFLQ